MQRSFVFLNLREATYRFVEAVICGIVVTLTHFTNHRLSLAWFTVETMVQVLLHADALPRTQDYLSAWLHNMLYAIYAVMYRSVGELLVLIGIIKFDDQIATATIDDILHLGPMEVHRRFLILFHYHNLFGVWFLIYTILAIPDGEQE